mmetsp:Transcript_24104/g.52231  ORF Transcript_24104/g.52231 Transcript_24104/m.52231 type:complete len:165 (+) Transcript_24104:1130-1624(+)
MLGLGMFPQDTSHPCRCPMCLEQAADQVEETRHSLSTSHLVSVVDVGPDTQPLDMVVPRCNHVVVDTETNTEAHAPSPNSLFSRGRRVVDVAHVAQRGGDMLRVRDPLSAPRPLADALAMAPTNAVLCALLALALPPRRHRASRGRGECRPTCTVDDDAHPLGW